MDKHFSTYFRRKLKPHELDLISASNQVEEDRYTLHEEIVEQEYANPVSDDDREIRRRSRRTYSRKGSSSSPKTR